MSSDNSLSHTNSLSDNLADGLPLSTAQTSRGQSPQLQDDDLPTGKDQGVVGFVQTDLNGRITFVNNRYCLITGYTHEELLGMPYMDLTHPDDQMLNLECFKKMMHDERPYTFEKRYIRKSGEIIWVNISASLQRDADGQPFAAAACVVGNSDNKRGLLGSHSNDEKYRLLLENSRDALITAAMPSCKFTSANRSALRMFGVASEAEFIRLCPWDVSPELQSDGQYSAEKALKMFESAWREGSNFYEWTHMRIDGRSFAAEVMLTRMEHDGQAAVQVTVRDISGRKRTEKLLRKSSEETEDLYNNAPCGYHSLDSNGVIRRINDTELAWLGYSRDEVVGRMKWPELLTSASQQAFRHDYPRFKKQGFTRDFEIELMRKDGTILVGLVNASAIYDSGGKYVMSRSTVLDITERKIMEKEILARQNEMAELQKLQIAAQTAAAFAHELNQPLLAISSYCNAALMLLRAEQPNLDKARIAIEGSERQAHRAGQSIRELLEILSMSEFSTEVLDLNGEILAALDIARTDYELHFLPELRQEHAIPMIQANRTHLRKVLLNLLLNSNEAIAEAGLPPPLEVTIDTKKAGNLAWVTIHDDGPGFKTGDIKHLFEPFFTTKPKGIGMGLAISRSLVEANGGRLWVDLNRSQGATFHFTLPLAT